jgi:hypothetical protein
MRGRDDSAKKTGEGSAVNILSVNRIAEKLFHGLFADAGGIKTKALSSGR